MDKEWMGIDQAAEYLGISSSALYGFSQANRIPAHKIGKSWRFSKSELDDWIKINKEISEFFTTVDFNVDENLMLREPQVEAYSKAYDFFATGKKKAIVLLPVGCGKSGLISILPFGIAKGRVLVIAPNLTIKEELRKALDISDKRFCFWRKCQVLKPEIMIAGPYLAVLDSEANIHDCEQSHIVLTNIHQLAGSADKWLPQFPDDFFDMILVDEGHHNAAPSWKKVFEKFSKAKVVSLTATPFRSDQKELEGELIYKYPFKKAMMKGYIKRIRASYVAPKDLYFTYNGAETHHTLEEVMQLKEEEWFSRGVALSSVCNQNIVNASLDKLEELRKSGTQHQLIAVACSVNHAKEIRSLYNERGYNAAEIYSNMPVDKQDEVLQALKNGTLDCIIQVQMLGEGFDHPKLSVAAIFRPFRALSPYVQFVGRIMRVTVQNYPGHPDNNGEVVTHIGLNVDKLLEDFRDLDKEDRDFFQDLVSGKEFPLDHGVLTGEGRQRLRENMVVNNEIVEELFQDNFIDPDEEIVIDDLKKYAEGLGFDPDVIAAALKKKDSDRTKSPQPFAINPQRQRIEARKRLQEQVRRAAKMLLNRMRLAVGGQDIAFKLLPGAGVRGTNLVAAIQLINSELNKKLKIDKNSRNKLKTDQYKAGVESLDDILNVLTRRLKKGGDKDEQER